MSSDLQSGLELLQLNNYTTVIIVTAVTYDYLLTLSREIEYIWCKPWTWISTLFFLVRYVGLCWAILNGLVGSTFVPGPLTMYGSNFALNYVDNGYTDASTASYLTIYWGYLVFQTAADSVMIMRIYAMWNRSKSILSIVLFICVPQIITSFTLAGIYYNPNTSFSASIVDVQVLDVAFCNGVVKIPSSLLFGIAVPRFVLSAVLFILAFISTLKESVEMYGAIDLWQPNRYMQRLLRDGILYFLINMLYNVHDIITSVANVNPTLAMFLGVFSYISICPILPRFIISMRELYDQLHDRWRGIDTGFGVFSQPSNNADNMLVVDVVETRKRTVVGDTEEAEAIELDPVVGDVELV